MSLHFHKLKIREIKKETGDCVSVSFSVPDELKDIYAFSHGQNVTLRATLEGAEVRRSYSICTAPYENDLRVAVKKAEQGLFSGFVHRELKEGDEIEILPPTGKFYTPLQADHKKKYLAFAAGSGITPVLSIIKTTLHTETQSSFTLIYSNRSLSSIIFLEELEGLKNKYINRYQLVNILSREKTDSAVNTGRLTVVKLEELGKLADYTGMDEIFICGPEEMIFTIRDFLIGKGVAQRKIHFELFNSIKIEKPEQKAGDDGDDRQKSRITVKLDGRSFDFDLKYDGDCILDAALKQGADLPYACKGGVCASCRARLTEGKVEMDMNWALEPEEVEQGFILTCQSHPKTERVVIDFDNR